VTGDRHDEIARRLRTEGAARAPERLRADVMLQVRAEPRPRRIRPRHSYWRPLGSLAAAACLVAAAAFGVTRIDAGGGVSGAGATSAIEKARVPAIQGLGASGAGGATPQPSTTKNFSDPAVAGFGSELRSVPAPLRSAYGPRFQLAGPLRRAFAPLEPRHGRGTHTP
jgi:hypothetical protein